MNRSGLRRLTAALATIPVFVLAACAGDNTVEPGASTPPDTPGDTTAEQVHLSLALNTEPAEVPVLEELIKRFQAANPNIVIDLSNVPYDQLLQQLPLQLESGEAPDIMRLTLFEYAPHLLDLSPYLSDVDYWMENMGPTQELLSKAGGGTAHPVGLFLPVTVTGTFVNKTLFEQAGVPLPPDDAGWEEWAEATRKGADATGTPARAVDRSGHRLVGPALSRGAQYMDATGEFVFAGDEAFADWVTLFVELNQNGTMAKDVWVSSSTFKDARDAFVTGELVFYYSG
ncbi:MAG: carbohydrate ABC transporter substrate-binding protein, partial [Propionibacteriaceae bacterium]|nr:carbohydrate ABC transporter substrate-binding protein [Propionibacteriaceae bacterium]